MNADAPKTTTSYKVFDYYRSRPGTAIHIGEAAADLNLSNSQVSLAATNLVADKKGLTRVSAGVYAYRGKLRDDDMLKKGDILEITMIDADSGAYVAVDSEGKMLFSVKRIRL